jgi:hypothetical protein
MNRLRACSLLVVGLLFIFNTGAIALTFDNSDFESGTTGWTYGSTPGTIGTFTADADAYAGAQAAKLTVQNADGYAEIYNNTFPLVEDAGTYTVNVYLKSSGNPNSISLNLWKSFSSQTFPTHSVASTRIDTFSSTYALHQIADVYLSPGEYLRLSLGLKNSALATPSTVWFDAISVNLIESELQKAISILHILAGDTPPSGYLDIDGDGQIGAREALLALQNAAGLRIVEYDPIGTWNGTLNGGLGNGQIIDWQININQTIIGSVAYYPNVGGTTTLNINTTYTFERVDLSFTATGTATYVHPILGTMTSPYTLVVRGTLSSDTEASGTFTIDFNDPTWIDDSGTWSATKS